MQEVFEKIIERLEEEKNDLTDWYEDVAFGLGIKRSIEIVKQAAAECKHGHFGCNSNGQHEKCSACCDYDCNNRNREWFGAKDDNNGWIQCNERMPEVPEEIDDDECPEFIATIKGANKATTLKCASDGTWFDDLGFIYDVVAWQPLPDPYQPTRESDKYE